MTFSNIALVSATVCAALMAGLFFSYSCSVVLAFKTFPDHQYIMGMQAINRAIQNPLFFLVFFGSLVLLPLCCYLNYRAPLSPAFWQLLAATIIYLVGVFGVTSFANVPMNNALDKFSLLGATAVAIKAQRAIFEDRWNFLNHIRTISSILSLILLVVTCINSGKR